MSEDEFHRKDGCKWVDGFLGYESSCLTCPLEECVLDASLSVKRRVIKGKRDREILNLASKGINSKEIAKRFTIGITTVYKVISEKSGVKGK